MKKHTRLKYLIAFIVFLIIEIIIAKKFQGTFIRNVVGDFIVVFLIYSLIRTCTNFHWKKIAIGVLIFSYIIEILQWINILQIIGIRKSLSTDLTLGATFDWLDMLAYTLSFIGIYSFESLKNKNR